MSIPGVCVSSNDFISGQLKETHRKACNAATDAPKSITLVGEHQRNSDVAIHVLQGNPSNQAELGTAVLVSEPMSGSSNVPGGTNGGVANAEPPPNLAGSAANTNSNIAETENDESAEAEIATLWQEAYEKLANDHPDLIRDLETIIKEDAGLDQNSDVKTKMPTVIERQKAKRESKQWSFHILGKEIKVRETVDNIFSLVNRSRDLIAGGMKFAPVYVSIPWTAIACLIPVSGSRFIFDAR